MMTGWKGLNVRKREKKEKENEVVFCLCERGEIKLMIIPKIRFLFKVCDFKNNSRQNGILHLGQKNWRKIWIWDMLNMHVTGLKNIQERMVKNLKVWNSVVFITYVGRAHERLCVLYVFVSVSDLCAALEQNEIVAYTLSAGVTAGTPFSFPFSFLPSLSPSLLHLLSYCVGFSILHSSVGGACAGCFTDSNGSLSLAQSCSL